MAASDPKARIMAHMNKEHGADLKRYLQAFNGLSSSAASGAKLTDLTFETLTIESASGAHAVRVAPPMKSFADARVRLVDMAERAQATLGLSDIRIATFQGPRGGGLVSFVGVGFYIVSAVAVALGLVQPGTAAWSVLDACFPYEGAAGFVWIVKAIAVPVAAIHVTEAWWMARSRLAKYGVETGSALWFKWVLETAVEGFPAFKRFDRLVREERAKKDAVKH
ncbi:putative integral membrane protein [Xylaria sp. FL1777]|nr:putative integral membrane protein [Xylaria sp. FL1777]